MKKKTFGRIAAIGLAGITAVPAIAIVASANVSYSGKMDADGIEIINGSAWKVHWSVMKTTHEYQTTTNNTLLDYPTYLTSASPAYDKDDPTTISGSGYALEETKYFTMQGNGASYPTSVKNAVDAANKTFAATKKKWEDYAYYLAHEENGSMYQQSGSRTIDGVTYYYRKDADTGLWGWYKLVEGEYETVEYPQKGEPDGSLEEYTFVENPTNSEISLSNLAAEFNTSYVKISGNEIEPGEKTPGKGNYVIGSSSVGSGSNGTTSGSYGSYYVPAGSYTTTPSISYLSNDFGYYFPSVASMRAAGATGTYTSRYIPSGRTYTASRCYFDPSNGYYYTSAEVSQGLTSGHAVYVTSGANTQTENAIYSVGGLYYYTWTSAYAAAGNNASNVVYVRAYSSTGNYFSRATGYFYATYADALAASGNNASYVVALNGTLPASDYIDPYYYYYLNRNNNNSSSSSLGGTSVTIGNKSGWTNVRTSIRNASAGTVLNVSLNGETYIPQEILSALDGKNVTVNFTLKNGAVMSFNGRDISNPKDISIAVAYNTKNISSSLVNKATSVNKAVSTSQLSISSNTFGGEANLTVKFNAKRAGYTAKLYRYNSTRNSLQLVDTATVASTGKATFDNVTQGGDFVIVLCG